MKPYVEHQKATQKCLAASIAETKRLLADPSTPEFKYVNAPTYAGKSVAKELP